MLRLETGISLTQEKNVTQLRRQNPITPALEANAAAAQMLLKNPSSTTKDPFKDKDEFCYAFTGLPIFHIH